MGNIPVLKPKEVSAILKKLGFETVRQRGSHRQYRHPRATSWNCPNIIIVNHGN